MTLAATEFMRRFLLHVLPKGFVRIRHYGFLGSPVHQSKLALCRALLGVSPQQHQKAADRLAQTWEHILERLTGEDPLLCPRCGKGHLVVCQTLPKQDALRFHPHRSNSS